MFNLLGIAGVFGAIATGYTLAGGHFGVIIGAAGPELIVIGGSGLMTLLVANDLPTMKKILGSLKKLVAGPKWKPADYVDALCMMFLLVRTARQEGNVALERHIEKPDSSTIFSRYPRLLADKATLSFIADVFRSVTLNFTDPHAVGEVMEQEIEKRHAENMKLAKAWSTVADAFPALGIVAAVLGVIKAMGAISESPEVLGHMIGSALVGTFMGVFLAYGIVGPIAGRIKGVFEEEKSMLSVIKMVITSHLEGLGPQLAAEVGRKAVPTRYQPDFYEMDKLLTEVAKSARRDA